MTAEAELGTLGISAMKLSTCLAVLLLARCFEPDPPKGNNITLIIHSRDAKSVPDAGIVFPADFAFDECRFTIAQAPRGCTVLWDAAAGIEKRPVECGQSFWVCSRDYVCPCPFDERKIEGE